MNSLLIAVIVILAICTIYGFYKGFISMAVGVVALVLSLFCVRMLVPVTTELIVEKTSIFESTRESVANMLENKLNENTDEQLMIEDVLELCSIVGPVRDLVIDEISKEGVQQVDAYTSEVENVVVDCIAHLICRILVYAILIIGLGIAFQIVGGLIKQVVKLPVLRSMDHLIGLAVGLLVGIILVWIVLLIITIIAGTGSGSEYMDSIQKSTLLQLLYENNIFLIFL